MATLTVVTSGLFVVLTAVTLHCCLCDRPDEAPPSKVPGSTEPGDDLPPSDFR